MRDYGDADMRPAAKPQKAALDTAQLLESSDCLIVLALDPPGIRKEERACLRKHQLASGTLIKLQADILFQQADLLENCWRR